MKERWRKFLIWLANFLGPKLDKYRTPEEPVVPEIFLPETEADLVWLLKKLPETVLKKMDRQKSARRNVKTRENYFCSY